MAIVQISKIQHRYGAIIDLPQLDEGELGWATDAKRLFIGKISPNENVEVLTSYSSIEFSQLNGSDSVKLNIDDIHNGQVLAYNASINALVNSGGNSLDPGNSTFFTSNQIHLGDVENLKIGGGAVGYVLETDGYGNVSWTSKGTLYINIIALSSDNPIVMTVPGTTPYTSGTRVTIAGVEGTNNTIVNGQSFYVKVSEDFPTSGNVELYNDPSLTSTVDGSTLVATDNTGVAISSLTGSGINGAGGSNTCVQYNSGGFIQGDSDFTFDDITNIMTLNGTMISGNVYANTGTLSGNSVVANAIGIGTSTPLYELHLIGNEYIDGSIGTNSTTPYTSVNRLIFENGYNDVPRGPNKITILDNGWLAGIGVHLNTVSYYSGNRHTFYKASNLGDIVELVSISDTGDIISIGNITTNGNISGNVISSNIVNATTVNGTTINGTLQTAAQPNITSIGTLSNLSVTGNVSAGNVSGANLISSNYLSGILTTATQFNITSVSNSFGNLTFAVNNGITLSGGTSFITGSNLVSANYLTGTLTTAAQPNVTSVSNSFGNLTFAGNSNITMSGSTSTLSGANLVSATYLSGVIYTAAQPLITSLGTLDNLTVAGNVSTNGIKTDNYYYANGTAITFDGTYSNANVQSFLPTYTGTVGAITATLRGQSLTTGDYASPGSITGQWTLTTGSRIEATYADLAENYTADRTYEAGTVLAFGGDYEVTLAEDGTNRVAGVVTTNPAYVMNSQCPGDFVASIALQGRVPTKVRGTIKKGDMLISAGDGFARASNYPSIGTVIGKALENFDGYEGVIEVAVGRL